MKILFICKNNQFRSQMAAAIYNMLTKTNDAGSMGTAVGSVGAPEGELIRKFFKTKDFFNIMSEKGMSLINNRMKKLREEELENFDVVISMAEEPFIPSFLRKNKRVIWWSVDNPTFVTRLVAEETYKQIFDLVSNLINNLTLR